MKAQTSEALNNQAVILAAEGHFKEAIACLTSAITVESKNHLLWFNLALTYRDMGDYKNAIPAMEQAFRINPYDEEIIEAYADLLISVKDFADALCVATIGLQVNNQNSRLWNLTGVIYFNIADYPNAAEAFEEAVLLNPYYYDALYNLRDTYDELGNKAGKEECQRSMNQLKRGND